MPKQSGYPAPLKVVTRRVSAALAALTVLGLMQVVTPAPAQATNWGSTACAGSPVNCVSKANNAYHVVNWLGDEDIAGMQSDHAHARDNQYNVPTDMVVYTDGSDPLPDVIVQDEPYGPNGAAAWVECPAGATISGSHPNRTCRGQILRYNATYAGTDFITTALRRSLACHEIGHTIGLKHRPGVSTTCMDNTGLRPLATDTHDRSHINDAW